ncbi:hypothetical protein KUG88_08195 [Rhodococcus rhodochrous]|uniref:hypothetical protein n=1 Tax=Rhodococcus rhodochrous TaxID=1829 RepID=UPI001E4A544C|nr:hypothetical protein [Rhodococcus rhodochrous]MCB8910110.1 hypothetical protein [Rhodococcus rhodochrous]
MGNAGDVIVLLLTLVAGVSVTTVLSFLVVRNFSVGLGLLSFLVISNWDMPIWPTLLAISGISISLPDLFTICFAVAALTAPAQAHKVRSVLAPLVVVLLIYAILIGIVEHGFGTAMNEARSWISIVAVTFWLCRQNIRTHYFTKAFEKWLLLTAVGVCLVAVIHIVQYGLGNATSGTTDEFGITAIGGRPITAVQAVFLALALMICIRSWAAGERSQLYGAFALALSFFILITQHRTVWSASVAGLVFVFFAIPSANRVVFSWSALAVAAGGYTAYVLGLFGQLANDIGVSVTDSRTYEGRIYDWVLLIDRSVQSGPLTVLLGSPFGGGWDRVRADGLLITYMPHNWYVATYLRIGLVGLILIILAISIGLLRASRHGRFLYYAPLVSTILVYAWGYNVQWYVFPVLAYCIFDLARPGKIGKRKLTVKSTRAYAETVSVEQQHRT